MLLVSAAWMIADARVSQRLARRALETAASIELPATASDGDGASGARPRRPGLLRGSAIADLSIPRVRLSAIVLHGSDDVTLRRGPGHLESSAIPGESGNVVIAGHRDTVFRPLRHLRVGDDIFLAVPKGRFHYRVSSLRVVGSREISVLASTPQPTLTLITCYPFSLLGSAPDRFVVQAALVRDAESAAPAPSRTVVSARAIPDDERLIRQAVERFRGAYNTGSVRSGARRALAFDACTVAVAGNRATATCRTSSQDGAGPSVWTFLFRKGRGDAHDGWTTTSVETN